MKPILEFPLTDEILTSFALAIGADLQGYRNHIYRVANFHAALSGTEGLPWMPCRSQRRFMTWVSGPMTPLTTCRRPLHWPLNISTADNARN